MSFVVIRSFRLTAIALLAGIFSLAAQAGELPSPEGRVILTIDGKIKNTNSPGKAEFDRSMLEALGVSESKTSTPWTDEVPVFEGVLASTLMEAVGALGDTVSAQAIDDYSVKIPISDFKEFPVLMAHTRDGKALRVRTNGPIWVVYPWDHYPELEHAIYRERSIWQLNRLTVE